MEQELIAKIRFETCPIDALALSGIVTLPIVILPTKSYQLNGEKKDRQQLEALLAVYSRFSLRRFRSERRDGYSSRGTPCHKAPEPRPRAALGIIGFP
jgi:hypothetical protein